MGADSNDSAQLETLGFVGVGTMGGPMSRRLLDAGYPLHVTDLARNAVQSLAEAGAVPADDVVAVASAATTVFLSLPTPETVERVCLGPGGVHEGTAVKRVVDVSTTGPKTAARIAAGLAEKGITYVDAPVSGGIAGATNGKLAIMVSCPAATLDVLEPILRNMGRVFFIGEGPGQAQTMKLANNLMAAAALAIASEAVVMGVKAGLDPKVMIDVINASSGRNSATEDKFPKAVLPRTFDFGFATGLSYKDVRLCVDESEALGVPMVVGAAVRQMLAVTNSLYGPESDFTSMVRVVENWAGVEVGSAATSEGERQ